MFLQIVYCIAMWVIEGCLTVTYCEFSFFKILINLCAIFKWLKDAFEGEPCHFLSLSPIYTMFFIFELAFIGTKPPDGDEWQNYLRFFQVVFMTDVINFLLALIILVLLKCYIDMWKKSEGGFCEALITKNTWKYATIFPYREDEESELLNQQE